MAVVPAVVVAAEPALLAEGAGVAAGAIYNLKIDVSLHQNTCMKAVG